MCLLKTAFCCWGNLQNSVSLNCVLSLKFLTRPPQQETSISASKDSQQLWLSVQTNCLTFSYFANNCTRRQLPSKRKKEKKSLIYFTIVFLRSVPVIFQELSGFLWANVHAGYAGVSAGRHWGWCWAQWASPEQRGGTTRTRQVLTRPAEAPGESLSVSRNFWNLEQLQLRSRKCTETCLF